ncbi:hypothetical protein BEST7613_5566 [Synechocystis sp. PCC 6803]|nr:hypothetical protein BEST7613_5566 [Synechocystis sp. PCC 6803] [Bacillus subtilis BEST7613]
MDDGKQRKVTVAAITELAIFLHGLKEGHRPKAQGDGMLRPLTRIFNDCSLIVHQNGSFDVEL